jgi:hypothetical protein
MDSIDADGNFISLTGNWLTTGTLNGAVAVTADTDATVTLNASDCYGAWRINNDDDVIDYTLPSAVAGMSICFYDNAANGQVVTVDSAAGDIIVLDGTALDAADAIDSPGDRGDFICLLAIDATNWISLGMNGTWVDGGAD